MSSKEVEKRQHKSKAKGGKVAASDLVAAEDAFLNTLGRKLRKQEKTLESIVALQAEIKSSKSEPDAQQ